MGDDLRSSTAHVLGADGLELAAVATDPFDHVAFDPSGAKVALVGRTAVTILRQSDGAKVSVALAVREVLRGNSVAFDADGKLLHVVTGGPETDGVAPIRLSTFSHLDADPKERVKDVTSVTDPENVHCVGLVLVGDHAVNLSLNVGQWSVKS